LAKKVGVLGVVVVVIVVEVKTSPRQSSVVGQREVFSFCRSRQASVTGSLGARLEGNGDGGNERRGATNFSTFFGCWRAHLQAQLKHRSGKLSIQSYFEQLAT
jgi:hypothetical protein